MALRLATADLAYVTASGMCICQCAAQILTMSIPFSHYLQSNQAPVTEKNLRVIVTCGDNNRKGLGVREAGVVLSPFHLLS